MGIEQICDAIRNLFDKIRPAAAAIPGIIMVCSLLKRPGLSVMVSAGNIIKRQSEFGAPTGMAPDGTPNMMNGLIVTIVDEVYRALREDANIQVAYGPGTINVTATGANSGGPVTVVGANINYGKGVAQML
jgi:hypothetical protein